MTVPDPRHPSMQGARSPEPFNDPTPGCASCRYAIVAVADDVAGIYVECHRYPPRIIAADADSGLTEVAFPSVAGDDWCGEHTPVE